MSTLITVLHVIVCLFLMLTVLLQSGKGGGMGAAFGGGNAATVFGSSGASGFLKRLTAIAGTIFMATSMVLAFIASHNSGDALERYGAEQAKIAEAKEQARQKALEDSKKNPGTGSAGSASETPDPASGSALPPVEEPATETPATETPAPSGMSPAPDTTSAPGGAATTPAKPAATTPAKPAATTPAKPAAKPAATTPAKPAATKPAKPTGSTPAKPAATKPAKPAGSTPAKPAATKPAKPAATTPATPAPQ